VVGDDPHALGAALERVLSDRQHADALAEAAREHCLAEYDIARVAERWDRVLAEVQRSR
jgi:glycosyltransferase involved in cell wall biosynthesis